MKDQNRIVVDINKYMVIIIIVGIIGTLLFISLIYDEVKTTRRRVKK